MSECLAPARCSVPTRTLGGRTLGLPSVRCFSPVSWFQKPLFPVARVVLAAPHALKSPCNMEVFRIDVTWSAGCGATCCPNAPPPPPGEKANVDLNGVFKGAIFDQAPPQNTMHFNTPGGALPCTKTQTDTVTVKCPAGQVLRSRSITHQCVCIQGDY